MTNEEEKIDKLEKELAELKEQHSKFFIETQRTLAMLEKSHEDYFYEIQDLKTQAFPKFQFVDGQGKTVTVTIKSFDAIKALINYLDLKLTYKPEKVILKLKETSDV